MKRRQVLLGMGIGAVGLATLVRRIQATAKNSTDPLAISQLWQDLETWLQQEIPELLADLNPGCSDQKLAELEQLFQQVRLCVSLSLSSFLPP